MWFTFGCQEFLGKIIISEEGSNFYVTDFKNVWHKFLNNNELLSIFRVQNPLLEAPVQKIKEILSSVCNENETVKKELIEINNNILFTIESKKTNINFKFELTLLKGDESMLYEKFTLPFLYTIQQLEIEKEKLITIIKEKDMEIEEYKRECGFIKNNFAQTKTFCEKEFSKAVESDCLSKSFRLDPKILKQCIGKKISEKEEKNMEKSFLSPSAIEEGKISIISSKKHKSVLRKENISQTNFFNNSVNVNHQIIKKKKKTSIRI